MEHEVCERRPILLRITCRVEQKQLLRLPSDGNAGHPRRNVFVSSFESVDPGNFEFPVNLERDSLKELSSAWQKTPDISLRSIREYGGHEFRQIDRDKFAGRVGPRIRSPQILRADLASQ